jgi:hypothetical protein
MIVGTKPDIANDTASFRLALRTNPEGFSFEFKAVVHKHVGQLCLWRWTIGCADAAVDVGGSAGVLDCHNIDRMEIGDAMPLLQ